MISGAHSNQTEKVLSFLNKTSPTEYNAKTLARFIKVKSVYVRVILNRLARRKLIQNPHRGFYRGNITTEVLRKIEDAEIKLHGLKLEGIYDISRWEGLSFMIGKFSEHPVNHSRTIHSYFEDHKTTITFHPNGLIEIFLNADKKPLSFTEFIRWEAWMKGKLDEFDVRDLLVIQIGENLDYRRFELDGAKSIKLQNFKNAWSVIYQKTRDVMRIETHLVTKISLDEATQILQILQPQIKALPIKEMDEQDRRAYL